MKRFQFYLSDWFLVTFVVAVLSVLIAKYLMPQHTTIPVIHQEKQDERLD